MRLARYVLLLIGLSLVLVACSGGQNTNIPPDPGNGEGQRCEGDFLIDGDRSDTDQIIAEVSACGVITGNLEIINTSLGDLSFLSGLTSVLGDLRVGVGGEEGPSGNDALTSLSGLESLTSVGNLGITGNAALTSLSSLEGITSVGELLIADNDVLTSLTGLEGISSVGALVIFGNDVLTSLSNLESITSIGNALVIFANISLTSLSGLESITSLDNYSSSATSPLHPSTVSRASLTLGQV